MDTELQNLLMLLKAKLRLAPYDEDGIEIVWTRIDGWYFVLGGTPSYQMFGWAKVYEEKRPMPFEGMKAMIEALDLSKAGKTLRSSPTNGEK